MATLQRREFLTALLAAAGWGLGGCRAPAAPQARQQVIIVGAAVCVEIWKPDDWISYLQRRIPRFRRLFDELPLGAASLTPEELGPTLLEPHPSWMTRIEAEWLKRYSR